MVTNFGPNSYNALAFLVMIVFACIKLITFSKVYCQERKISGEGDVILNISRQLLDGKVLSILLSSFHRMNMLR